MKNKLELIGLFFEKKDKKIILFRLVWWEPDRFFSSNRKHQLYIIILNFKIILVDYIVAVANPFSI